MGIDTLFLFLWLFCSGSSGSAPSLALPWLPSTTRWSSGPSRSRAGLKLPRPCRDMPVRRTSVFLWCLCLPTPSSAVDSSSLFKTAHCCCTVLLSEPRTLCIPVPSSAVYVFLPSWRFKLLPFAARVPVSFYALGSWQERADIMRECESIYLVKFASKSNWFRFFLVLFSFNRISTGFAFSSDMPPGN